MAPSHYLNQCWPKSMSPYGFTRVYHCSVTGGYCGFDVITLLVHIFHVPMIMYSRVSCQKGPTRHAYAWQIGPFWQDTLLFWCLCDDGCCWHHCGLCLYHWIRDPDSKVHGANMGPIWGRQDPGGPHVGPITFAIWEMLENTPIFLFFFSKSCTCTFWTKSCFTLNMAILPHDHKKNRIFPLMLTNSKFLTKMRR